MRDRLFIIAVYFFIFFYANSEMLYGMVFQKDDYLWVEFGGQIKEKNGSVTQPLLIYHGRFPNKRSDALELEGLMGFYTLDEKDERGEKIFYPLDVERTGKAGLIKVNSLGTNCFTVLIRGRRNFEGLKYDYLAKTSFFLFGHSPFKKKKTGLVPSNKIINPFQIHTISENSYWPQVGNPVKITLLFDENPLSQKRIHIADESGNSIDIETDEAGNSVYIPPDDQQLRRKGPTAYKETLILAEEKQRGTIYKSSYTLLSHRSRFGDMNLLLGATIFGATSAIVFINAVIRRKNFRI